jgi:hypothetical protein
VVPEWAAMSSYSVDFNPGKRWLGLRGGFVCNWLQRDKIYNKLMMRLALWEVTRPHGFGLSSKGFP